jgi:hypothetical protein
LLPKNLSDDSGAARLLQLPNLTYTVGKHNIELIAIDSANNTAACTFSLVVTGAAAITNPDGVLQGSSGSENGLGTDAISGLASGLVMLVLFLVLLAGMYVRHQTR